MSAGQRSVRPTFHATVPFYMEQAALQLWAKDHGGLSVEYAWSMAHKLASNYLRRGCLDGWTPATFFAMARQVMGASKSERTLRKYVGMILAAEIFTARRLHGCPTGRMLRATLHPAIVVASGLDRAQAIQQRRRQQDTAGKARRRREAPPVAHRRTRACTFLPGELDQIAQEIEILSQKRQAPTPVRPITTADAVTPPREVPTAFPLPMAFKKQIPLTPTPMARGPERFGVDGLEGQGTEEATAAALCGGQPRAAAKPQGGGQTAPAANSGGLTAFTSPEALEDHLYRFVAGQPLSAAPKLREQVGPVIYQALAQTHIHGLQGLKQCHVDAVRAACRRVARAHAPRPKTARQRAERFRLRVDRSLKAASRDQIRDAAVAILGPVAAKGVNPGHLAHLGLSMPQAEDALGRVQRHLKVGSAGPTALRNPGALNAYAMATFRKQDRTGRPPGRSGGHGL